jgi:hypothetical protein
MTLQETRSFFSVGQVYAWLGIAFDYMIKGGDL